MLPLGVKVFHPGHGEGEVIGHNGEKDNKYFEENSEEITRCVISAGIISTLATSFYSGDMYPNIIKFNSGYKNVYADYEVTVIN